MQVQRIRLGNTVFEGQNNVYVLTPPDGGPVLVDTGVATPTVQEEFTQGLADLGVAVEDVSAVFVTHWHYDHSGLVGYVQESSGAPIYAHEADAGLIAGEESEIKSFLEVREEKFTRWGIPTPDRAELEAFLEGHGDLQGPPADVTTFTDGATFDIGGVELEALHLPGHAAGLTGFAMDRGEGSEFFAGDVILPKYTPNVGGADPRVEHSLKAYVTSLERVIDRDFVRAWPGHRDVIEDPSGRAAAIIGHHRDRTRRVMDVLREQGGCDAWTVSAALFGGLENIHIMHGPGEAFAHLEHLEARGFVERDADEYVLVEDVETEDVFPTVNA